MAKSSKKTAEQKLLVVLSVLRGEYSAAEAARLSGPCLKVAPCLEAAGLLCGCVNAR